MKSSQILSSVAAFFAVAIFCSSVLAESGASGKTYASSAVSCAPYPVIGVSSPFIKVGLYKPKGKVSADVSLNGVDLETTITADNPETEVWLADGDNEVQVAINKHTVDTYTFYVPIGHCDLPDTSGNTFNADGTLEYAASGKSYATVVAGCAWNPATARAQPYINLFDNGDYLLNVSVNDVPLTQLSPLKSHTPVFLGAGTNVISAANGSLSIDYYIREGGDGTCILQ